MYLLKLSSGRLMTTYLADNTEESSGTSSSMETPQWLKRRGRMVIDVGPNPPREWGPTATESSNPVVQPFLVPRKPLSKESHTA